MKAIGVLDTDARSLEEAVSWLNAHAPDHAITIQATSWGKLLTDSSFPPDVVLLRFRPADRVDISYETRVCRILELEVIVLAIGVGFVLPSSPERVGARVVYGLEEAAFVLAGGSV